MLLWLLSLSVLQHTTARTSKEITTFFYFGYPVVLHKLHVSYQFPSTKLLILYRYGALHVSASYLVVLRPKLNTPTVFSTRRCIYVGVVTRYEMGGPRIESR